MIHIVYEGTHFSVAVSLRSALHTRSGRRSRGSGYILIWPHDYVFVEKGSNHTSLKLKKIAEAADDEAPIENTRLYQNGARVSWTTAMCLQKDQYSPLQRHLHGRKMSENGSSRLQCNSWSGGIVPDDPRFWCTSASCSENSLSIPSLASSCDRGGPAGR